MTHAAGDQVKAMNVNVRKGLDVIFEICASVDEARNSRASALGAAQC